MLFTSKKVDITPKKPLPLMGYKNSISKSGNIENNLEANIVLFENKNQMVILVSVDTLYIGENLEKKLRERFAKKNSNIFLISTHTHSAPSLENKFPKIGMHSDEYIDFVANKISAGINECIVLEKSNFEFFFSATKCEESIYRRKKTLYFQNKFPFYKYGLVSFPNQKVKIPNNIQFVMIKDLEGKPLSIIWCWPCHPVAFYKNSVSPDFPGEIRNLFRKKFHNIPILYFPGFAGDIRPNFQEKNILKNFIKFPLSVRSFRKSRYDDYVRLNEKLFSSIEKSYKNLKKIKKKSPFEVRNSKFPLNEIFSKDSDESINLDYLNLFGLKFLFLNGEVCSPYYKILGIDQNSPFFASGYSSNIFGYLPSKKQIVNGGYEVDGFKSWAELEGKFTNDLEEVIKKRLDCLIK